MDTLQSKNEYAKHVSLFLAELLRTRKIDLERAADIAQKVLQNINLIDNEQHFLQFVKELSRDFEELFPFETKMQMHVRSNVRKDVERKVQSYAVHMMSHDMGESLAILQEAIRDEVNLVQLCQKFPKFQQYIEANSTQWTK
ncbi:MAG: hypothetical protein KW802_01140 [Candidatus Doudnabacteria bacterium]|nr:hypothetical protein [Candidatus Doudnabacteria bacterium]